MCDSNCILFWGPFSPFLVSSNISVFFTHFNFSRERVFILKNYVITIWMSNLNDGVDSHRSEIIFFGLLMFLCFDEMSRAPSKLLPHTKNVETYSKCSCSCSSNIYVVYFVVVLSEKSMTSRHLQIDTCTAYSRF